MTMRILEMRGITKTFPGVKALDERQSARGERRDPCAGGRERRRQIDADEGAERRLSARLLRRRDRFQGEERRFTGIADSEKAGIVIIHQELALVPLLSIAENIFLGNEQAKYGVIDWSAVTRGPGNC